MKKYLIASIALLAVVSCAKEVQAPVQNPEGGKQITISATIPVDGLTKVDFEEQGGYTGALKLTWATGDQITVTDASNEANTQVFTLTAGEGTASGTFTGTALAAASSYNIVYDSFGTGFNYAEQTQATDGSTAHLKYSAALTGVSSYTSFSFDETWASTNGGSFASSSVLRLRAEIPFELTDVQAVYIKSDPASVFGSKGIKVNITTPADEGEPDILTVYAALPFGDLAIPAGTGLVVQFQVSDKEYDKYTAYRTLGAMTLKAGMVNNIGLDCNTDQDINKYANKVLDDIGTVDNPYIIGDQHQMAALKGNLLADGEYTYIKIVDDIDMTGIVWEPLNYESPYKKYMKFDGQNHSIFNLTTGSYNYPSLFGVLYGECKDLIIDGAKIVVESNYKSGIVAGYLGTSDAFVPCVISNVIVQNSSIGTKVGLSTTRTMGAFAGQAPMENITITDCHVFNTTVTQLGTSTCHAGGFIGYSQYNATFTDCTTEANVTGNQFAAGFAGYAGLGVFTRCVASGTVSGSKDVGGFVGKTENPSFIDCGYTGSSVSATDNTKNAHPGGFVGYACKTSANYGATFTGCYVNGATLNTSSSQRVGGFVGQADAGNTFTKCYVKDVTMQCALNSGGFVGVSYAGATTEVPGGGLFKCYVDGGILTANGNNCGGFVGYPENCKIEDSYTSMNVVGSSYTQIGGFIGNCRGGNTVTNCFESGTISGSAATVGAFIGELTVDGPTVSKCIAWNNTLEFMGSDGGKDVSNITDNYVGTSGTISAQATTLGWDTSIWDLSGDVPVLK